MNLCIGRKASVASTKHSHVHRDQWQVGCAAKDSASILPQRFGLIAGVQMPPADCRPASYSVKPACAQFWDEQYWQNFKAEREEEQRRNREAAQRARQLREGVRPTAHRSEPCSHACVSNKLMTARWYA